MCVNVSAGYAASWHITTRNQIQYLLNAFPEYIEYYKWQKKANRRWCQDSIDARKREIYKLIHIRSVMQTECLLWEERNTPGSLLFFEFHRIFFPFVWFDLCLRAIRFKLKGRKKNYTKSKNFDSIRPDTSPINTKINRKTLRNTPIWYWCRWSIGCWTTPANWNVVWWISCWF